MPSKLINIVGKNNLKNVYYNTACLKITKGHSFDKVHDKLIDFAEKTNLEKGCIEFFVAPGNIDTGEFMLWEIWDNENSLKKNMQAQHTKAILSEQLVELLWSRSANMKKNDS